MPPNMEYGDEISPIYNGHKTSFHQRLHLRPGEIHGENHQAFQVSRTALEPTRLPGSFSSGTLLADVGDQRILWIHVTGGHCVSSVSVLTPGCVSTRKRIRSKAFRRSHTYIYHFVRQSRPGYGFNSTFLGSKASRVR